MGDEKETPLLLNPALPRYPLWRKSRTKSLVFPASFKSRLHNYFAAKMAAFSNILGLIYGQTDQSLPNQPHLTHSFTSLYNRLVAMRAVFLNKYHQLLTRAGKGLSAPAQKIDLIYDHIDRFENQVVWEIVSAGIRKEELIGQDKKQLLEPAKRLQA